MGVGPRRQAHPLTVSELAQIVSRIDTDRSIGIRDRAVILLLDSTPRPPKFDRPSSGGLEPQQRSRWHFCNLPIHAQDAPQLRSLHRPSVYFNRRTA